MNTEQAKEMMDLLEMWFGRGAFATGVLPLQNAIGQEFLGEADTESPLTHMPRKLYDTVMILSEDQSHPMAAEAARQFLKEIHDELSYSQDNNIGIESPAAEPVIEYDGIKIGDFVVITNLSPGDDKEITLGKIYRVNDISIPNGRNHGMHINGLRVAVAGDSWPKYWLYKGTFQKVESGGNHAN